MGKPPYTWDYDKSSDVLYITKGKPDHCYVEESPEGLLVRYTYKDDLINGITILGYKEVWSHKIDELIKIAGRYFNGDRRPTPV